MIYWLKRLPKSEIDFSEWTPVSEWNKSNFMYFVYALQILLIVLSIMIGVWNITTLIPFIGMFILVYLTHELLHIIMIYKLGDISITHSGIFFWINSSAMMSKLRFWLFITLPFIVLTIIPTVISLFTIGLVKDVLVFVSWTNAIIAGADIINSIIIITKPNHTMFCRGYYKVKGEK